jgi:phospholipid/cholesterol/gamma-HCH transport system substrate-binding protein
VSRIIRIGIFTAIGVALIVAFSVYVNDHPYWYRPCNEVKIHVDDATGLRRKSPVRTLGLEIGYINAVDLDGDRVLVKVCVTGPVKLNAETRAYIRSSGFLGDKFLELKPVDRVDGNGSQPPPDSSATDPAAPPSSSAQDEMGSTLAAPQPILDAEPDPIQLEQTGDERAPAGSDPSALETAIGRILSRLFSLRDGTAHAQQETTLNASREAELQDTIKKVGKLIDQLTLMVGDLREVTQQKDFKETIVNLNAAMKHLEQLLRPTGKVMKNVDAAMESLKNTMADAEAVMKKVKEGEGTVGKLINDPSIYEELKGAIKSINLLLGKAGSLRTYVDISGQRIPAYNGNKAKFSILIAPNPGRYYLLGITSDPRGRDKKTTTTTSVNGSPASVEEKTVNEEKGLRITAMFGKYFGPLDLRVGIIEDSGAVGVGFWFDADRRYGIHADIFSPGKDDPVTARVYGRAQVWSSVYFTGGVDTIREYKGQIPYFYGIGLFFDDDDLKYLLAFR